MASRSASFQNENAANVPALAPDGEASQVIAEEIMLNAFQARSKVLSVPELLSMIVHHCDNHTKASCARISREWSQAALDDLWRAMDTPLPLLKLGGPMGVLESADGGNALSRQWIHVQGVPSGVDWSRFRGYASRIRELCYDDKTSKGPQGDPGVIITEVTVARLQYWHPFGTSFLPNLVQLHWCAEEASSLGALLPFLSERLEDLDLVAGKAIPMATISQFLQAIELRTPNLKRVEFVTTCRIPDIEEPLCRWLAASSAKLEFVTLPRYCQTALVVRTLAAMPRLRNWAFSFAPNMPIVPQATKFDFIPGGFPYLDNVDICMSLTAATELLRRSDIPSSLDGFGLDDPHFTSNTRLEEFLEMLAAKCPDITVLELNLFTDGGEPTVPITFDAIRPVFGCKNLKSLIIGHDLPIILQPEDVEEIGQNLLDLEELELTPDPVSEAMRGVLMAPREGNKWEILKTIAMHLPDLRNLGLYLTPPVPRFDGDLDPLHQFDHLHDFIVGTSPLPFDCMVAAGFYLASLARQEFSIVAGPSNWHYGAGMVDDWLADDTNATTSLAWTEATKIISNAARTKQLSDL